MQTWASIFSLALLYKEEKGSFIQGAAEIAAAAARHNN